MQWPSRAEYTEAVRDYPHVSLQDPRLEGGEPRRGNDNFVISDTGAFSIVFPIDVVSKTFALRCWVKNVSDAKHRYEKISAYLKHRDLPYFVDFEYVPEGILVNGIRYPITRMEWVEGVSLREFIEQNLQNPHSFKVVADEFQKMVATLHKHEIAHGDLQDGNILLNRNSNGVKIKLIDYDSLFVPKLRGQPEQILGLPGYQHPTRMIGGRQANKKVDYFSELVIYLSFLSLAEKPELWNQYGLANRVGAGLLFSKEDFENPDQSDVFQELEELSPDVQELAATLKDFCTKTSIDQLAPLEAILPTTTKPTSTSTSRTSSSAPAQPTRSNSLPNAMKHITKVLRNHWQSVAMATLGLALVICFIALLTQMNTENKIHLNEIAKLKNQLNQKESKTRELTALVQALESDKKKLTRENDRLREDLEDLRVVVNQLQQQLSETEAALASSVNKNQTLQSQVTKKDAEIRQLQNDITIARKENRRLQSQIDRSNSRIINLNDTVQQLKEEKAKVFNQNQRLQNQNQDLARQNQRLRNENKALQKRLDNTKQNSSNQAKKLPSDSEDDPQPTIRPQMENLTPEPPKKIQEDRTVRSVDISRNNQGCFAFEGGDYDKAINQFEQAIKADSKFTVAYYNLGCVYLETKKYKKAVDAFDEAASLDRNFKEAYYNLSLARFRIKTFQSAKQAVEKALSIDPNYQLAQELLTEIENAQQ